MAGEAQAIRQAVRQLAGSGIKWCYIGTVVSVDKSKNVCIINPLNGDAEITDVRLNAEESSTKGIVIYPKEGSVVMVSMYDNMNGYISMFSEVESVGIQASEKITLNGDSFGGLVKINELVTELLKVKIFLQTLQAAIQSSPVVPTDGGAAFKAGLVAATSGLQIPDFVSENLSNPKIKHGDS